jgi:hypothetical protein
LSAIIDVPKSAYGYADVIEREKALIFRFGEDYKCHMKRVAGTVLCWESYGY